MEGFVSSQLEYLEPVEESWQPQDWLPDMTGEDWVERVQAFREPATGLSDAVLVVLVVLVVLIVLMVDVLLLL